MKTGKMALGALVVVIAGGAMTTEPRGMQDDGLESEADTYIPCLGELAVYRKTPPKGDWTRCFDPSY